MPGFFFQKTSYAAFTEEGKLYRGPYFLKKGELSLSIGEKIICKKISILPNFFL